MFKQILLATAVALSLVACGGGFDSLPDIPNAGTSLDSHVTSPVITKPNPKLCREIEVKNCKEIVDKFDGNMKGACVLAQQAYSCDLKFLDKDNDGYLCEDYFRYDCPVVKNN